MHLFGKNLDEAVVVVAEIGVNHEGSLDAAKTLVRLAKETGADAAKLQSYTPERYASASDPERLARVSRFCLDEAQHRDLAAYASKVGLPLFSTPVTEDRVPLLDELFPAMKIASGDITFKPVITAAARTGKPVILSTGAASMDEIRQAVGWIQEEIGSFELSGRLVLMQCTSAYPCPPHEVNLASIGYLHEQTGLRVGYSNHMTGIDACLAAIAMGACVIEAHFTDSRSDRSFRDHELSLEPAEFSRLVSEAPKWRAMRGIHGKSVQPSEKPIVDIIRKGVVAALPLKAGTVLTARDLAYARPGTEFAAIDLPSLIGRRVTTDIGRGEIIKRTDLQ